MDGGSWIWVKATGLTLPASGLSAGANWYFLDFNINPNK
jgi:hypothetical protein